MSLPYPIKPNFSICFKGFSQIAKTVSHVRNAICIILAENESKYTEKASIFYHFVLACLIFSYIIDAKTVSHIFRRSQPTSRAPLPPPKPPRSSLPSPGIWSVGHPEYPKSRQSRLFRPRIRAWLPLKPTHYLPLKMPKAHPKKRRKIHRSEPQKSPIETPKNAKKHL